MGSTPEQGGWQNFSLYIYSIMLYYLPYEREVRIDQDSEGYSSYDKGFNAKEQWVPYDGGDS